MTTRSIKLLLIALLLWAGAPGVLAQDSCPAIVNDALAQVDAACDNVGRNQACYGHTQIDAQIRPAGTDVSFVDPGDIADLVHIQALELAPMSIDNRTWGVAWLQLQANLPDTLPGQNVTMLLFGDVRVENAVDALVELPVTATVRLRVRSAPDSSVNNVIGALDPGQTATANGRLADGSWLRIEIDHEQFDVGWVAADFVTVQGDINNLNVVDASTPIFDPMDAFYFNTGIGDRPCMEAPDSGILVQTPEGAATITLTVNEAQVALASTAFLQAGDGQMWVYLLENRGLVAVGNAQQVIPAGTFTTIPLDGDGLASDGPALPQAYDISQLQSLPVNILPRPVQTAPPLPQDQAMQAIANMQPFDGDWFIDSDLISSTCDETLYSNDYQAAITFNEDGSSLTFREDIVLNRIAPGTYQGTHNVLSPTYDNIFTYTMSFTSPVALDYALTLENRPLSENVGGPCTREFSGTGSLILRPTR